MSNVSIEGLADAIGEELTTYSRDVIQGVKKEARKSMTQLVKQTKATAPVGKRDGHYRDNITSRKESETATSVSYTWYVKGSDYRLSHLLEKGHASRNGGRVAGTGFIRNASEPILENYKKAVEEVIRNGS